MSAATCPSCSAYLPAWEVNAGWCDNCGKKLPAGLALTATAPIPSATPIALSVPVVRSAWPTVRWVVQMGAGAFLVLFFGAVLALIVLVAKTDRERFVFAWGFGPLVGLPLAAALNGLAVGAWGRRLTFLGVAAVVAATFAFGFLLYGVAGLRH